MVTNSSGAAGPVSTLASTIDHVLRSMFGRRASSEGLGGGKSGAHVWCLNWSSMALVVKRVAVRERYACEVLAGTLSEAGVHLPLLHHVIEDDHGTFLVLEHVPPVATVDTTAPEAFAILRALHDVHAASFPHAFRPSWPSELTARAVDLLGLAASGLANLVRDHHRVGQQLFTAFNLVSSDPNPTNWGRRASGEPVLLDWDRVGFAHTAVDLAITTPGLGDPSVFGFVAETYLGLDATAEAHATLARLITAAKLWTVFAFVLEDGLRTDAGSATVARLRHHLVPWLRTLA